MISQSYAPKVPELTDSAVVLIWGVFPGYSSDKFDHDELYPSVRQNIELATAVVQRGNLPDYGERKHARELGARRASQGVPLESVIQAYRSSERVILLDLLAASRSWSPAQAGKSADLVISTFDLLTEEMINAYRETSSDIDAARRRVENEVVTAVASGLALTPDQTAAAVRILGVEVSARWFALALLSAAEDDEGQLDMQRLRRYLHAKLQAVTSAVVFGDVGKVTFVLISAKRDPEHALTLVESTVDSFSGDTRMVCGVGEVAEGLDRTQQSCAQALHSAKAALARRNGSSVVRYEEALIEVLLSSQPTAANALVHTRIAPLFDHPHLLDTLRVIVEEDLSQSRAARRMFVHVNTVGHRVKRIAELTGYTLTRTPDIIELAMALRWFEMSDLSSRFPESATEAGGTQGEQ